MNLSYGYGANNIGRIRTRTDFHQPEHSAQYSYDAINRLTAVTGLSSTWGISWGLDTWGNRTGQTPSGLATGKVGAPTSNYTNNRNDAFSYDLAGNVLNDGLHNYAYDAEGRITQIDGGAVQFAYDGDGRRVKRTGGSTTTYYVYGLTGLMSEFSTTAGTLTAASTDRLQYRVGEHTGTAVLLLSPAGTVLENNRVLPYGELWSNFTSSRNDQKFTTYDRGTVGQSDSELDYAMARFYGNRYPPSVPSLFRWWFITGIRAESFARIWCCLEDMGQPNRRVSVCRAIRKACEDSRFSTVASLFLDWRNAGGIPFGSFRDYPAAIEE